MMSHSAWDDHPDYNIDITLCIRQIKVVFNGKILAESKNTLQLKEQDYPPIYYFPRTDVRMELFEQTSKSTHCPFKGEAQHWALMADGKRVEVAAWSYLQPYEQVSAIQDHIAFYPEVIGEIIET